MCPERVSSPPVGRWPACRVSRCVSSSGSLCADLDPRGGGQDSGQAVAKIVVVILTIEWIVCELVLNTLSIYRYTNWGD